MFRIVLAWNNVPPTLGAQAAVDIGEQFTLHRPWHHNVTCTWDQTKNSVLLQAENDFDSDGLALLDEFSDAISACVKDAGDGGIRVLSATAIPT
jgi:hypothetical protein